MKDWKSDQEVLEVQRLQVKSWKEGGCVRMEVEEEETEGEAGLNREVLGLAGWCHCVKFRLISDTEQIVSEWMC